MIKQIIVTKSFSDIICKWIWKFILKFNIFRKQDKLKYLCHHQIQGHVWRNFDRQLNWLDSQTISYILKAIKTYYCKTHKILFHYDKILLELFQKLINKFSNLKDFHLFNLINHKSYQNLLTYLIISSFKFFTTFFLCQ